MKPKVITVEMVKAYIAEHRPGTIKDFAEANSTDQRTVQRYLKKQGTLYSKLRDEWRIAEFKSEKGRLTNNEMAEHLGMERNGFYLFHKRIYGSGYGRAKGE